MLADFGCLIHARKNHDGYDAQVSRMRSIYGSQATLYNVTMLREPLDYALKVFSLRWVRATGRHGLPAVRSGAVR